MENYEDDEYTYAMPQDQTARVDTSWEDDEYTYAVAEQVGSEQEKDQAVTNNKNKNQQIADIKSNEQQDSLVDTSIDQNTGLNINDNTNQDRLISFNINQDDTITPDDTATTREFQQIGDTVDSLSPVEQNEATINNTNETIENLIIGSGDEYENPTAPGGNSLANVVNRTNKLTGNIARTGQFIVDSVEGKDGENNTQLFSKINDFVYENNKMNYKPTHTWDELKKATMAGGLFDLDTWQEVLNYSAETAPASMADLAYSIAQLPLYIVSRTQEYVDERVKNDNRKEATASDYAIAAPFATGEVLLNLIGAKAVTLDVAKEIGKLALDAPLKTSLKATAKLVKENANVVGKATAKEMGTEFTQEGIIQPLGESIGTETGAEVSLEKGVAGMIASGVISSTVAASMAVGNNAKIVLDNNKLKKSLEAMFDKNIENYKLQPEQQKAVVLELKNTQDRFVNFVKENPNIIFPKKILENEKLQKTILKKADLKAQQAEPKPKEANKDQVVQQESVTDRVENIDSQVLKKEVGAKQDSVEPKSTLETKGVATDDMINKEEAHNETTVDNIVFRSENINKVEPNTLNDKNEYNSQTKNEAAQSTQTKKVYKPSQEVLASDNLEVADSGMIIFIDKEQGSPTPYNLDGKEYSPPAQSIRVSDIAKELKKISGDRIYNKRIPEKYNAKGLFKPKTGEIRMHDQNDPSTLIHEIAHFLDFKTVELNNPSKDGNSYGYKERQHRFKDFMEENKKEVDKFITDDSIESFAEMMTYYMMDSEVIHELSPTLYDKLEAELKYTLSKKEFKGLKKIQKMAHAFYNQGAQFKNQAQIAKQRTKIDTLKEVGATLIDAPMNITKFIDIAHPVVEVMRDLDIDNGYHANNPYVLFRHATGHSESTIEAIAKYGVPTVGKDNALYYRDNSLSLGDVFEPVLADLKINTASSNNAIIEEVYRYFQLKQAIHQMEKQNKKTSFNLNEAKLDIAILEKKKGFKEAHKKWLEFNDHMLDFYVQSNKITADQKRIFQLKNPYYVPTHRVIETSSGGGSGGGGSGKRSKKGSNRELMSAENMFTQLEKQITDALQQRANSSLFSQIEQHQDGAEWAVRLDSNSIKYKNIKEQEMSALIERLSDERIYFDESGSEQYLEDGAQITNEQVETTKAELKRREELNEGMSDFLTFGVSPIQIAGSDVIPVVIDGKQTYFEVNKGSEKGRLLLEMFRGIDSTYKNNYLLKTAQGIKNIFVRSIVATPNFILGNAFIDTTGAGVYTKAGFVPFVDSAVGAKSVTTEDSYFRNMVLNGGAFGTRVEMSTKEARKLQMMKLSLKEKSLNRGLNTYDRVVSIGEMATRTGEYRLARKKGIDPLASAYLSTEISTDFNMHGSHETFNAFRSTVAFLPASINSMYKDYREWTARDRRGKEFLTKESAHLLAKLATRGFVVITIPAIISMLTMDNEDTDDMTVAELGRFSHYKIGEGEDALVLKHKTQFLLGAMFEKAPKAAMQAFRDDYGEKEADVMLSTLQMLLLPEAMPTVASPWYDLSINERFTGAPIIPRRLERATGDSSYLQYTYRTPLLYVELAQKLKDNDINMSPIKMQYVVEGYLGYVAKWINDTSQKILWDSDTHGEMPNKDATSYLTHHFKYNDYGQSYYISAYYSRKKKVDEMNAEYSLLKSQKDVLGGDAFGNLLDDQYKQDIRQLDKSFRRIKKEIKILQSDNNDIMYNKNYTSKEKDNKMKANNKERGELFKEMFIELDKELKMYEEYLDAMEATDG